MPAPAAPAGHDARRDAAGHDARPPPEQRRDKGGLGEKDLSPKPAGTMPAVPCRTLPERSDRRSVGFPTDGARTPTQIGKVAGLTLKYFARTPIWRRVSGRLPPSISQIVETGISTSAASFD